MIKRLKIFGNNKMTDARAREVETSIVTVEFIELVSVQTTVFR